MRKSDKGSGICRTRVDDRLKLVQNGCGRVESKVRRMSGERGGRRRRYREFGIEMVQAGNAVGMPDERRYLDVGWCLGGGNTVYLSDSRVTLAKRTDLATRFAAKAWSLSSLPSFSREWNGMISRQASVAVVAAEERATTS